jgi:hypothetical protein
LSDGARARNAVPSTAAAARVALLQQQQQQLNRRQVIAKAFATADRIWRETMNEAAGQPAMQRSVYSVSVSGGLPVASAMGQVARCNDRRVLMCVQVLVA